MTIVLNKLAMNILRSGIKISNRGISTSYPLSAHWNKDWAPAPYPKTEAERRASAEKYGLHPRDYQPYPDDGTGFGDYPKLPDKGSCTKDPQYPYDIPEHKRNFGEPIHTEYDLMSDNKLDVGSVTRYSKPFMAMMFITTWASLFFICYITKDVHLFQPVMEKQYPWKGKTHYTFEKAD